VGQADTPSGLTLTLGSPAPALAGILHLYFCFQGAIPTTCPINTSFGYFQRKMVGLIQMGRKFNIRFSVD